MWSPERLDALGPVYVAIANALARDVESGRLEPGERLPTHRALARQLGVNVVTVTRAYQEAARRGLVEGEVGRGTFVRDREAHSHSYMPLEPLQTSDPGVVDFVFNVPVGDPSLLDTGTLLEEMAGRGDELLGTGYNAIGLPEHREAGAAWIGRSGLEADPARVMVTCGVQHGMAVVLSALAEPGDLVLAEELTYPGLKALANILHLRLAGLPMDHQGLLPDAFETACRRGNVKALYCQPNLQNPTGVVLPEERRRQVAEIARRYGVPIVEDDTSGFPLEDAPLPIAAHAPELTFFLAGTSKSIAPGLRTGYALVPDTERPAETLERVAANLAALTWMAPPLAVEMATRLILSGRAGHMVDWKRKEVAARRALVQRHLGSLDSPSHPNSYQVWLPLPSPWRGEDFVAEARRRGVAVSSAELFVIGRASAPHAVRLAIGRPESREVCERGLAILAETLERAPTLRRSIV